MDGTTPLTKTLLHSLDCCHHLDRSGHIQAIGSFGIRTVSLSIEVFSSLCHNDLFSSIYVTFSNAPHNNRFLENRCFQRSDTRLWREQLDTNAYIVELSKIYRYATVELPARQARIRPCRASSLDTFQLQAPIRNRDAKVQWLRKPSSSLHT